MIKFIRTTIILHSFFQSNFVYILICICHCLPTIIEYVPLEYRQLGSTIKFQENNIYMELTFPTKHQSAYTTLTAAIRNTDEIVPTVKPTMTGLDEDSSPMDSDRPILVGVVPCSVYCSNKCCYSSIKKTTCRPF